MQNRKILLSFGLLMISIFLAAQPKFNSPWSRIGLGELSSRTSAPIYLNGGIGAAFNDPHILNMTNPASLGFLRATGFEIGLSGGLNKLKAGDTEQDEVRGELDYLSLAFPLRNPIGEILERKNTDYSWSMGFDLRTNSLVGYDIRVTDSIQDIGNVERIYLGDGGTYTFGWSNALRYKDFSVGAEIGVLFGNISATRALSFDDLQNPADDIFIDDYSIRGFKWKLGVMYKYLLNKSEENIDKKRYWTVGGYGNSNNSFNTDGTRFYRSIRQETGVRDTIVDVQDLDGGGTYPANFGLGMTYTLSESWEFGVNYEFSDWSNFSLEGTPNDNLEASYRIGIGASYIPDPNAYGKYFKRVKYRAGFQYYQDPRVPDVDPFTSYTVTAGLSMPFYFIRQVSTVHLGLEYSARSAGNNLNENYFGIKLGATFSDNKWFYKRKFN